MSNVYAPQSLGEGDSIGFSDVVSGEGATSKTQNSIWIIAAVGVAVVLVVWLLNRKK